MGFAQDAPPINNRFGLIDLHFAVDCCVILNMLSSDSTEIDRLFKFPTIILEFICNKDTIVRMIRLNTKTFILSQLCKLVLARDYLKGIC